MRATKVSCTIQYFFIVVLVFYLCNPVFALTPEIYSIEPDHGSIDSPTEITIYDNNVELTPKVSFYGDGSYVIGSVDTRGSANGFHVSGN